MPPFSRQPRYVATGARARAAAFATLLAAAAIAAAGGCGPIEYINQVGSRASGAVAAAKAAQADHYAPYEMTAAEEYLHEAREEAGHAEYQVAIEYGRKAEELATRARAIAMNRLNGSTAPAADRPAPAPSPERPPQSPAAE